MTGYRSSDDYEPLFYARGYPVTLTVLLVATHVLSMVACTFLLAANHAALISWLDFSGASVLRGEVWRLVTYTLDHRPSLGFAIEMAMLFFFGREVERYLGRRAFGWLYCALVLTTPLLLLGWSLATNLDFVAAGTTMMHFGIFIAFAAIYPSAQIFFGLTAKWMAVILLAIYTLVGLASQEWRDLAVLWLITAVAVQGARMAGVGEVFSLFRKFQNPFPRKSSVPRGSNIKPRIKPRRAVEAGTIAGAGAGAGSRSSGTGEDVHDSIDPLLDKISKHGIGSLSQSERATLERARASLLRRERGN
ncbi:MAG: rhomboid family intramembrane serine protease [Verrucomicrobia bacterium]|nr:rhomboid family intramembrane serine protease [Verrucomicrobiota bacterium]